MALDTCAVDGLCATACPVNIDTGKLTKRFRQLRHTAVANNIAVLIAKNMKLTEFGARFAMGMGHAVQKIFGLGFMRGITRVLDYFSRRLLDEAFWQWCAEMPRPRRGALPRRPREGAVAVYFPACISRIMGALPGEQQETTVMQALLNVADRAGVKLYVPDDIKGNCCGVPFSSKGFEEAHHTTVDRTIENFYRWSNGGELPVVVDTSPCTYGLKTARPHLSPENQAKFDKLTIFDSVEFAHDRILPALPIQRKVHSVALHPVCSAVKMSIVPKLVRISNACSESVLVPRDAGCCAFAGDRGFLFPELTASATALKPGKQQRKSKADTTPAADLRDRDDAGHRQGLPVLFAPVGLCFAALKLRLSSTPSLMESARVLNAAQPFLRLSAERDRRRTQVDRGCPAEKVQPLPDASKANRDILG